jgi:hypothetical protein
MVRLAQLLGTATVLLAVAACQSEQVAPAATNAAPVSSPSRAATTDDPCGSWLAEVKAMCTAFVEGREVADGCARQSIAVHTSFAQPEMQDPKVGPAVCNTHLTRLQRDLASETLRPAVAMGDECKAFAAQVRGECIDTLGTPVDAMVCNAKLTILGTARNADAEGRESACEMGRMMYAN